LTPARRLVGGTRLVGRTYYLGRRPVRVVTGWGPGARVRNVRIRFADDGSETIRPFRGLTLQPRGLPRGRRGKAIPVADERTEADTQKDPARADSRDTGGVPDPSKPDQASTTGTTPDDEYVGRVAGDDPGDAGEDGAERRAQAEGE
jgi:hypothetical protein